MFSQTDGAAFQRDGTQLSGLTLGESEVRWIAPAALQPPFPTENRIDRRFAQTLVEVEASFMTGPTHPTPEAYHTVFVRVSVLAAGGPASKDRADAKANANANARRTAAAGTGHLDNVPSAAANSGSAAAGA